MVTALCPKHFPLCIFLPMAFVGSFSLRVFFFFAHVILRPSDWYRKPFGDAPGLDISCFSEHVCSTSLLLASLAFPMYRFRGDVDQKTRSCKTFIGFFNVLCAKLAVALQDTPAVIDVQANASSWDSRSVQFIINGQPICLSEKFFGRKLIPLLSAWKGHLETSKDLCFVSNPSRPTLGELVAALFYFETHTDIYRKMGADIVAQFATVINENFVAMALDWKHGLKISADNAKVDKRNHRMDRCFSLG